MKVDPSVETYQVGAHFKALIKAILVAPSRILENFFSFQVSLPRCEKAQMKNQEQDGPKGKSSDKVAITCQMTDKALITSCNAS